MDSLLIAVATSLIAHKYVSSRKRSSVLPQDSLQGLALGVPETYSELGNSSGTSEETEITGSYALNGRPASMSVPMLSETPLRRQEEQGAEGFQEQFFPQDTRATGFSVTQKPWMIAVQNSEKPPRTEKEAAFPTESDREDIHKTDIPSKMRNFDSLHTQRTIPRSKEKQFESPVAGINTQNEGGGGLRGQRQLQRYHKFLLNEQPRVEFNAGPRGNFSGANKSSVSNEGHHDDSRQELVVDHSGVPVAASFKVGIPDASFELEGSNAESWSIDKHTIPAGSRGPVEQNYSVLPSFKVAHDDAVESFHVSKNSSLSKSLTPKSSSVNRDTSDFKDATIDAQTVLGAPGGSRLEAASTKHTVVKHKAKDELLALGASKVDLGSSSKSSGPGALKMKKTHAHTDEKLAEEDTAGRVRGASILTKNDVTVVNSATMENSLMLNDSKGNINQKEFTSNKALTLAAPQNLGLPRHLRVAPTSSITATTDMTLKSETDFGKPVGRGKNVKIANKTTLSPIGESTPEERRMKLTLLNERMATGDALKLLANPYARPAKANLHPKVMV